MNCKDVQELLSAYVDNECTTVEQSEIIEHLTQCSECHAELVWLQKLIKTTNELDEIDIPEGFHENLMHKIHEIHDDSSRKQSFKKRVRPIYSIVAAAFLFVVVFGVFGTQQLLRMSDKSTEDIVINDGAAKYEAYDDNTSSDEALDQNTTTDNASTSNQIALKSAENSESARVLTAPIEGDEQSTNVTSEYPNENEVQINGSQEITDSNEQITGFTMAEPEMATEANGLEENSDTTIDESVLLDNEDKLTDAIDEEIKEKELGALNPFNFVGIGLLIIIFIGILIIIFRKRQA